jgi:hypothetical protein
MARKPQSYNDPEAPPGPYDSAPAEPWFTPDLEEAAFAIPLPQADRRPLLVVADWAAAQGARAGELADLALVYGTLEQRLRAGPAGWRHRLALREAADLSWAVGDRIPVGQLALWEGLRLSGVQMDAPGLARASWALRRLSSGVGQGWPEFFGRQGGQEDQATLSGLAADLDHLHPVTRAVALGQVWQRSGPGEPARQIEAMVLTACLAGTMARSAPGAPRGFVPQALSGGLGNTPEATLAAWLRGATAATTGALSHLDRVLAWQDRAALTLADLQGRTPALLLAVLGEWPMVTAGLAERLTGANKATVLRNLSLMQARGLLREVTGQGRYRVWTAAI